ncbi:MAG: glycosyltransferase family 4 protein [Actinomycetota bacterium]|nr:glycosyltransferase family 4 protein [Actinomycetota bacterium]
MGRSLLFLVHTPPLPAVTGARLRSLALVRELVARGWDVSLFSLDTGVPAQPADLDELRALCREVRIARHAAPKAVRMARMGADLLRGRSFHESMFRAPAAVREARAWITSGGFDAIVTGTLYMLPYVSPSDHGRMLLDTHNLETARIATMADALWPRPRGVIARLQQRPVRRHEERAAAAAGGVLAVSAEEGAWFERCAPGRVTVVSNGVDCAGVRPREGGGRGGPVLFVGSMDYEPNVDGARMLLDEIAPRLTHPGARIALVGALPPPDLRSAAAGAPLPVEVTGRVPQIAPWFACSRLLAVPLRIGGGTRFKIVEAMAHGLPVVTTTLGCAGLDVEHGRDILIADDPAQFARLVDRLLADDALARDIARRARQTVERRYDWRAIGDALEQAVIELLARQRAPSTLENFISPPIDAGP